MKRRNFLKNIGKLSAAPLILNGVGVKAFATPNMLTTCNGVDDRSMVIVFLKGGNDGLNTIVPIDQYAGYIAARPNIGLKDTGTGAFINLDNTLPIADQVGIHPSMTSFKTMYEAGNARIIQGVGYPSFNQSHFKSTDYWLGGSDGVLNATESGWLGRFFENAYPGIHNNPTTSFPDPLGVQLGDSKASLSFHDCASNYEGINLTGQAPENLFGLLNGLGTAPHSNVPNTEFGEELQYIMDVENSTNVYGQRITNVYNAGTNSSTVYPNNSDLGYQLSTVARLLDGGSKTKTFMVHRGGFDTHANQVQSGSTHLGTHADLMADVFDSIKAFHADLDDLGLGDKVVTLVFSEFSRRVTENGSLGTDHGNYAPMFVFGNAIEPGITGTNLDLSEINGSGNLNANQLQYDYRQVYSTLLQNWMGAGDDILTPTQLAGFGLLPNLITSNQVVDPVCYIGASALPIELNYFDATLNDKNEVVLNWETLTEVNHGYFEIQRSLDTEEVETIDEVAGQTNSNQANRYASIDKKPYKNISYYRLRSVDLDGKEEYSNWESIYIEDDKISQVKVYPNPAVFNFNLVMTVRKSTTAQLELYSIDGKLVIHRAVDIEKGFNKFSINVEHLPKGNYMLRVINERLGIQPMQVVVA